MGGRFGVGTYMYPVLGRGTLPAGTISLVAHRLATYIRELLLGVDDAVQVRLHQLRDDVDVVEGRERRRLLLQRTRGRTSGRRRLLVE
jgi:hypothetical protein